MSKEERFRVRQMLQDILVGRTIKAIGFNRDNQIEYIKLDGKDGKLELHLDPGQHHVHDFRKSEAKVKSK
jgi:hypothetical protein